MPSRPSNDSLSFGEAGYCNTGTISGTHQTSAFIRICIFASHPRWILACGWIAVFTGTLPRCRFLQRFTEFIHEAPDLVTLCLARMPESHWPPPAGMALCLSPLTKLRSLFFGFEPYTPLPDQLTQAPAIRPILPALTSIHFNYVCHYVEDLVAQIDCPRLNNICLRYPQSRFIR